ncbi:hypothetical protein A2U01_0067267, partial [Trifolium medium]|nr:hypothetical protein [Trifolium medium]
PSIARFTLSPPFAYPPSSPPPLPGSSRNNSFNNAIAARSKAEVFNRKNTTNRFTSIAYVLAYITSTSLGSRYVSWLISYSSKTTWKGSIGS